MIGMENDALKQMMAFNRQFMETNKPPELNEITEFMRTITGADYAVLNLLDESTMEVVTEAVAGVPQYLSKITKILGFDLLGKRWPYDMARHAAIESRNITIFESMQSSMGNVLPPRIASLLEKALHTGQMVIIKINRMDQIIGEFTLFMPKGKPPAQLELADLFASQVGLYLDRMKYQQALEKERQRLSDIIDATHVGTWDYNVQTGENSYNQRWTEILGYTLTELEPDTPDSWIPLVHPEDYPRASQVFQEAVATGTMYTVDFRLKHKDGHWVWVEDRGKVVSWTEDGKPLMMSGTRTDITERKEAETKLLEMTQEAQRANEAKSRYLAHMNHEIRTPMNGFMAFLHMMEFTRLDEEQQEFMLHMKQSASHILGIINNVLDYAKIEAGGLSLTKMPFNLAEEVQTAVGPLRSLAKEKNLTLTLALDENLPQEVLGDPQRLRQIILNLGGNAVKFTEHGLVDITIGCIETTEKNHMLILVVEDTGCGMTEETLAKLFQPFFQADDGTVRQSKGTGLGMPITKELVDLMGGSIQVDSRPGKGTRVEVLLNLTKAEDPVLPQ